MTRNRFITLCVLVLLALFLVAVVANRASAENDEPCVPSEAWTETIPGTPDVWANFQPNNHKEPFVGPPSYPSDPRGSWNVHDQIPGGHEGPDGVYSKGNPDKGGNWFYRANGTDDVVIEHPAVICEEEPTPTEPTPTDPCAPVVTESGHTFYPCDPTAPPPTTNDPTDPPSVIPPTSDVPDEPRTDDPPVLKNSVPEPDVSCLGGALVTRTTDADGNSTVDIENGSPECPQVDKKGRVFQETGL
jgi:hypothetical protein